METQENCCTYCELPFGQWVVYRTRIIQLRKERDHFVPGYTLNGLFFVCNLPENIVPSCQICNEIKSNTSFKTIEAARIYIKANALLQAVGHEAIKTLIDSGAKLILPIVRHCGVCNKLFPVKNRRHAFCSQECRDKQPKRERRKKDV